MTQVMHSKATPQIARHRLPAQRPDQRTQSSAPGKRRQLKCGKVGSGSASARTTSGLAPWEAQFEARQCVPPQGCSQLKSRNGARMVTVSTCDKCVRSAGSATVTAVMAAYAALRSFVHTGARRSSRVPGGMRNAFRTSTSYGTSSRPHPASRFRSAAHKNELRVRTYSQQSPARHDVPLPSVAAGAPVVGSHGRERDGRASPSLEVHHAERDRQLSRLRQRSPRGPKQRAAVSVRRYRHSSMHNALPPPSKRTNRSVSLSHSTPRGQVAYLRART